MLRLTQQIALDVGTSRTRVALPGKGVVYDQPTVVAVDKKEQRVVAIGTQAEQMIGKTPEHILASRPIRRGVITEYQMAEAYFRLLLFTVLGRFSVFKPDVFVSVPMESTPVERRAMVDALLNAGAKNVYLVDAGFAALVGSGVSLAEANGHMMVVMGAGLTECVTASLGGIVDGRDLMVAGETVDADLVSYVRKQHHVELSLQQAEEIKRVVMSAVPLRSDLTYELRAKDVKQGVSSVMLTSGELLETVQSSLGEVQELLLSMLQHAAPELVNDIIDKGILVCGGGALLRYVDRYFTKRIGVPVTLLERPTEVVVQGLAGVAQHVDTFMHAVTQYDE